MDRGTHEQASGGLTPQRRVVLEVIRTSEEHLTAAEISFGSGASRYDRETARHDHAICSQCGRLVDFDLSATVGLTRAAARRSHFKPESIHLTLIELCPECREDQNSTLTEE